MPKPLRNCGALMEDFMTEEVRILDRYQVYAKDGELVPLPEFLDGIRAVFDAAEAEARLESIVANNLVEVTRNKLIMIAADVVDIVLRKNEDYQDAWQRQGIQGTLARIADKLCRVEVLADGREALVAEEKLEQTLLDNIGYSFLALLWLREKGVK